MKAGYFSNKASKGKGTVDSEQPRQGRLTDRGGEAAGQEGIGLRRKG